MSEPGRVTEVLRAAANGDADASAELLPLVYDALRNLARARMADLPPGNTLQPTALVHEAYVRLVEGDRSHWNTRGHFFAAAAQSMRQILVDQTRRKAAQKHGGGQRRVDVDNVDIAIDPPAEDILALDAAIERLQKEDPRKAQIVMYRYFAGLDREETAAMMNVSVSTLDREWRYIRARLHKELRE